MSTSKIASWVEAANHGASSELNSNLYRNRDNPETTQSTVKRHKSYRSTVSNKRKKRKHQMSIGTSLEKQKSFANPSKNTFATQLISLIQQLHSPSVEKSHNHSQSEVYTQNFKRIVQSKSGQHYKAKPKSSMHSRSNTSDNPHKIK
jgi:hypothetical protein